MKKQNNIKQIIESIKVIEKQIEFFENKKKHIWFKKNKKYNNRIRKLENTKQYLYKLLEYKMDE